MIRRRFGRTELDMPIFSCGGMRYQHSWKDAEADGITVEDQQNLDAILQRALELGINHFETARGYGTSEFQLGQLLPQLNREDYIFQTKGGPRENLQEFINNFETSMGHLKLDYIDLFGIHGINTPELLEMAIRPGGCVDQALTWKAEGRIRHLGFSTHGITPHIVKAIETGIFDYVNLHCYFVNPLTRPAVEAAHRQDMGVFIISPNEKGGKLFAPSEKLVELCHPLTPIQFNFLYTLQDKRIKTLSIGASHASNFDDAEGALAHWANRDALVKDIEARLRNEINRTMGDGWHETWMQGLPWCTDTPGEMNIPDILRMYTFAKALDMADWAKMMYNLLGNGHWWPGQKVNDFDEAALVPLLADSPHAGRIPGLLREAHNFLNDKPLPRLSQGR